MGEVLMFGNHAATDIVLEKTRFAQVRKGHAFDSIVHFY